MSDRVLALAESVYSFIALGAGETRIERPHWTAWLGSEASHPEFTIVQRLKLEAMDVGVVVNEVRAVLRGFGRTKAIWEIGPSATPSDLVERLLAVGLVRYEEPTCAVMVLRAPLAVETGRVVVRQAVGADDFFAAFTVLNKVFAERVETEDARRVRAERAAAKVGGARAVFLATIDDVVVGACNALYTDDAVVLLGSAVLPEHRGKGAYRAMVAARYDAGLARGTPTLVIQAGKMSRPILERLGFETLGTLQLLLDAED